MFFGEIVEPTSRALIVEEDDLPSALAEYVEPTYEWQGDWQPPTVVETLIIAESNKVLQVCTQILQKLRPQATLLNEGISIYKIEKTYLITYSGTSKTLVAGQIAECLSPWIKVAQNIHAITTDLILNLKPWSVVDRHQSGAVSRCLTTEKEVPFKFCPRLESPNLVQGFAASIFSFCVHNKKESNLWVIYMDNMPLDSINSAELVRLFKILGLSFKMEFKSQEIESNLYM